MAKKLTKKKPTKKIKQVSSREKFLEILIEASERAVTKQGSAIDEFFQRQANRLRAELKGMK